MWPRRILSFVLPQIAQLFDDPLITDVSVGPNVLAIRQQGKWRQLDTAQQGWLQQLDFEEFCTELVERYGGRLDFRVPLATVVAGDFRAHAVLGSALGGEAVLTVRRLGSTLPFICSDTATQIRYARLVESMRGCGPGRRKARGPRTTGRGARAGARGG